jgi:hypothetical protein
MELSWLRATRRAFLFLEELNHLIKMNKQQRVEEIVALHAQLMNGKIMESYMQEFCLSHPTPITDSALRTVCEQMIEIYDALIQELKVLETSVASVVAENYRRIQDFLWRKLTV